MTLGILAIKAGLDLVVAVAAYGKGDVPGAILFFTFVLVDLASMGVLK